MAKDLIKVDYKVFNGFHDEYKKLQCTSIEPYGTKLTFADSNGELLREGNKIIEVPLEKIIRITTKK